MLGFFWATMLLAQTVVPKELVEARQAVAQKNFTHARELYEAYLQAHPGNIDAELGIGDVELGLHQYETAELQYRKVVAHQPELWLAHKNLVIVEAALGRWEEFDRERAVLRAARQRNAPGISARESDVIDSFDIHGQHWIVREYYEPVGRSLTRYNFELFSPEGRVQEYISLESANAAAQALTQEGSSVRIGIDAPSPVIQDFALNWYTGKAHGTIAQYPRGEPSYEAVRAAVRGWLRIQR
jgi:hypothetical protein